MVRVEKNVRVSNVADVSLRLSGKRHPGSRIEGTVQKKRKHKPGTIALREIRKYQKSTDLLLAKSPFFRLIREIVLEVAGEQFNWQKAAVEALQEIAEAFMVSLFEDANSACIHAKRVTVRPEDIHLVRKLRRDS